MPSRKMRNPFDNISCPAIMFMFLLDLANMLQEIFFFALLPSGVKAEDVNVFLSSDGLSVVIQVFWPVDSVMMNPMQRWHEDFPTEGITRNHHALVSYIEQLNQVLLRQDADMRDKRTIKSTFTYNLGTRAEQPFDFEKQVKLVAGNRPDENYVVMRLYVMRTNAVRYVPRQFSVPRANW